jgi:hypothetical protein
LAEAELLGGTVPAARVTFLSLAGNLLSATLGSVIPGLLPGQEVGELRLKDAEFVAPRVVQDPEVKAAFGLMIPADGAESLSPADFDLHVVGFQVQVHTFLAGFPVAGLLQENPYLGIRETEATVNVTALLGHGLFGGAERLRPERDAVLEIGDVDDEVA